MTKFLDKRQDYFTGFYSPSAQLIIDVCALFTFHSVVNGKRVVLVGGKRYPSRVGG